MTKVKGCLWTVSKVDPLCYLSLRHISTNSRLSQLEVPVTACWSHFSSNSIIQTYLTHAEALRKVNLRRPTVKV